MSRRSFGELELEILQILKNGKRMTVKDVHHILGKDSNKYTTILTVMGRLVQKGTLSRERIGLQYEYWLSDPTEKIPSFIAHFKKKIFGVQTSQIITYLIESADDLSEEDLADMEKMIEKAKMNRRVNKF
ncbi:BlaI/MecI/CopY family transcriptional regulator [Candidatus Protochlamydia phocaeensis]|uniref:BlaI/MecI/CopY family transcriptional regulator n=1 Tax=Candidatus Protochlamydia phocaeensis TaxID=1414722 RepID=UPI00083820CE|nr:BlaI/MecI/CopY family transcriptional regulator [Candidatus Protochlamydia phocaeensis]